MNKDMKQHIGNVGLMLVLVVLMGVPFLGFGFMRVESNTTKVLSDIDVRQNVPVVTVIDEGLLSDTRETTDSEDDLSIR